MRIRRHGRAFRAGFSIWIALLLGIGACQNGPEMSGTWVLDKDRSSNVDTWSSIELRITASAESVAIGRLFNPRRDTRHDSVSFPVDDTQVEIPMTGSAKWLEQPHLGLFIDGETPQLVRANWGSPGLVLNVQHLQTVETSQGESTVEILREYTLSDDGSELTLVEERSSRPEPLTYVFTRKQ